MLPSYSPTSHLVPLYLHVSIGMFELFKKLKAFFDTALAHIFVEPAPGVIFRLSGQENEFMPHLRHNTFTEK